MNFIDYVNEVKRRVTLEGGGTDFDVNVKRWINMSIQHIRTLGNWKPLRRKRTFTTEGDYTTGTIDAITNGDTAITGTGTLWITGAIRVGRRIKINDDTQGRVIKEVTAEGAITLVDGYGGSTDAVGGLDYTIIGTEEYILPYDWGDLGIFWHEAYGRPYKLTPITDSEFYGAQLTLDDSSTPEYYRLWGTTGVTRQPIEASAITVVSSSVSDTTQELRIAGLVSGQWDYEDFKLNGTTAVVGTKSFSEILNVSLYDSATTPTNNVGRITLTSNTGNVTNLVIPVNFVNKAPTFYKVQLYPLPDEAITINVDCYDRLAELVDDNDVCPLGKEFDEAIVLWACYIGDKFDKDKNTQRKEDFKDEIKRLRSWNNKDNDKTNRFRSRDNVKNIGRHFLYQGPYFPMVGR